MIPQATLQFYQEQYKLAEQIPYLAEMNEAHSLEGKRVLEVGGSNIPRPFIFDVLKSRQWISVDRVYPQNRQLWPRQYQDTQVIPMISELAYSKLGDQVILDGQIERLPESFAGQFDIVLSMNAFEHIHKFASMLDRVHTALKPGGCLLSRYSPIWSSYIGHHLWGITDKRGKTFYIESSPIMAWGHLIMRPAEMYHYLLDHTDPETADEMVYHVYHSENVNRLFYEDYEGYFKRSRFGRLTVFPVGDDYEPDPGTRRELERLHPGRIHFEKTSVMLIGER